MNELFLINPLDLGGDLLDIVNPNETIIARFFNEQIVIKTLPNATYLDITLKNVNVQLANQGELREKLQLSAHDYVYWFGIPYNNKLMPNNRNQLTAGDYLLRLNEFGIPDESKCYIIKDIAVTSGTFMTLYAIESAQIPGKTEIMDGNTINPIIEL